MKEIKTPVLMLLCLIYFLSHIQALKQDSNKVVTHGSKDPKEIAEARKLKCNGVCECFCDNMACNDYENYPECCDCKGFKCPRCPSKRPVISPSLSSIPCTPSPSPFPPSPPCGTCQNINSCGQYDDSIPISNDIPPISLKSISRCLDCMSCIKGYHLQVTILESDQPNCCPRTPLKLQWRLFTKRDGVSSLYDSFLFNPCGDLPPCKGPLIIEKQRCIHPDDVWYLQFDFLDLNTTLCPGSFAYDLVIDSDQSSCPACSRYFLSKTEEFILE